MKYEILYKDKGGNLTDEETDNYTIYEVDDEKTFMRVYKFSGDLINFGKTEWQKYEKCGLEHDITEDDLFLLEL